MFDDSKYIKTSGNLLDYFIYKDMIDLELGDIDERSKRDVIIEYLNSIKFGAIDNLLVPYGSYAYGAISINSDLDIVCLSDKFGKPRKKYFRFWDEDQRKIIPAEIVFVPTSAKPQDQWYGLSGTTSEKNAVSLPLIGTMAFSIPEIWGKSDAVRISSRFDADRLVKQIARMKFKKIDDLGNDEIVFELIRIISRIFNPNIPSFKNAVGELHRRLSGGLLEVWEKNIEDVKKNSNQFYENYQAIDDEIIINDWVRNFTIDRLVDMGNLEFARNYKYDHT